MSTDFQTAADEAVLTAQAAVALGEVQGQLGFELTQQSLEEASAVMVFPLLALSVTAISEGLLAYAACDAEASLQYEETRSLLAAARKQADSAALQARAHWSQS